MFALGLNVLGEGTLSNIIPPKTTYDKLSLYGDCILDQLHMKNVEMTDISIIDKYNDTVADTWGINTILLANFEDTLEAGNILTGLGYPLDKFIIRRKIPDSSLNPILVTIDNPLTSNYKDYTCKNNVSYIYTVYPAYTDGTEGQGIEGDEIFVSFSGYVLSDTNSPVVTSYTFDYNNSSNPFKSNRGMKVSENHTKYPAVRFNNKNYRTGGLSTMPLEDDLTVSDTLREEIINFLNNGEEKILRTPSGDAMRVITMNANYKYEDAIAEQPATIDFEIIEVGDV